MIDPILGLKAKQGNSSSYCVPAGTFYLNNTNDTAGYNPSLYLSMQSQCSLQQNQNDCTNYIDNNTSETCI